MPTGAYQKRPAFLTSPTFQELSRQSFQTHAASQDVSPDAYFARRHSQLRAEQAVKKLIYLDTNHWINLRHVVLNSPMEQPGYREILNLLTVLHTQDKIRCPFSFFLFIELTKETDPVTRLATARLIDRFSGGLCFQFPPDLARAELRHFLLKTLANQPVGAKAWAFTKVGFLARELLPEVQSAPGATKALIKNAWIDLMWAVRLEHVLELTILSQEAMDYWQKYAAASNADAAFYRSTHLSYNKVLEREKALFIRKLIVDELARVGQELWDAFPQVLDVAKLQESTKAAPSPWAFPSFQILAGISAAAMRTPMKFEANDMLDFRHAALAIPYCDAVCCDSPMPVPAPAATSNLTVAA